MKYLKRFESTDNYSYEHELKKLLSHLAKVFSELGFNYNNYYDRGRYETIFDKDSKRAFNIFVDPYDKALQLTLSVEYQYIYDYFKTISGLVENGSTPVNIPSMNIYVKYIINFNIKGKPSKLIKKFSKEDFEMKMNSNKYNL